jgi:hypothetical protein
MFTVHHLWGRTLNKHHQECAVAYADDAYIKILVKGISAADAHAAAQRMLNADPSLAHLRPLLSPASFVVDGYIGLGVPIGLMLLSSTLSVK